MGRLSMRSLLLLLAVLMCAGTSFASGHESGKKEKTAIVIASFGTTVPSGLPAITNIIDQVKAAYPETEVRVTFTSNIIRSAWKKRQAEADKWLKMGIPKEILYVKNIISTFGDLQEEGYRNIIVQPTHMFFMEQSHDLNSYVNAMNSIRTLKNRWKPFNKVVLARPALGMPGDEFSYHDDVDAAIKTLAADVELAKKEDAALVYMGHGNEHWSTGIYAEVQKKMRAEYPEVKTIVGVVEGDPNLDDVVALLKHSGKKKVILKPFMIVAGDHATNDMAGEEEDSWKSVLTAEGYDVQPVLHGLGENDAFAKLFVKHIAETAKSRHLSVK